MKMLNIKSDGTFSFVCADGEGASDTADQRLSVADAQLIQDEIDTLLAQGLQEIHFEVSYSQSFVHKVGVGKVVVEDDPNAYNAFVALDQWGPSLVEE